ncbi:MULTISPECIES: PucR family transcriptional regulator ligand-binding domain-containing protein [unclassified Streptomyces]|uniref:PucR family transcriptional regulator ligand-binding domain-containing protein n=1 Tax=unclassified Streptomyces TaxID=2593676 RepID=UPI002257CCE5|nr:MULTISPECIES: PucR family transcriptional regulator ligand-binding domain-containing protein [unclassified Streptomyces]WSP58424.1 PucR family transcriptional regulator ligand-binding domain-containing protein [Streptomyces sp. NBC_01241]WSU21002.1 PucR family transcriptional regulator ligand-binding domain-containing protein [Streptomyces sp. NBC_01108]MCX4790180.1 PucR family transcriptional regulator ligand-binding domain-containing protein [Streptomyces sp. NBC_01221]MCX4794091.1 PucR fa
MRLRALLETDALGLRLLGGENELDRTVRGVMTTDLRDPSRYLSGGELVLSGLAWRRNATDSEPFVRILAGAGVAGLAAGEAELGNVPGDLVEACAKHRLPLFAVHETVAFATITEHVVRQVSGERAGDLAAVVDRHRRLMTSGPAGGGPEVVLDLLGSDLDLHAWVLSPTGRLIAGAGDAPLAEPVGAALAGHHLAATRTGRRAPHRTTVGGTTYSLFPIRNTGREALPGSGDVRESVLSDWLLAVEADASDWPPARLDLLQGVTQLIAVERDRRDAARAVRRRLAQEVLELVQTGAPPTEIAARLRVAAPVLLPGLGAAPHWQVVVARVEWGDAEGSAEAGGPSGSVAGTPAVGPGSAVAGGPVAQALLEEILVDPAVTGSDSADRIAVAHTGDEAVALVPLPAVTAPAPAHDSAADAAPVEEDCALHADVLLAAVREPLSAGLADDGRLTLGVSAAVHSPEGLRGALEEARHARRVAAARPGRVCAAGHHELASHVLLLPFVPDDVRRAFTARLLDPLRDYDRRHRAELIPTLEAFLDCDGSWTRCASRLHLHVNTLRYRVGRIEQLTGRDLSRLEDKLDFFLALRMS